MSKGAKIIIKAGSDYGKLLDDVEGHLTAFINNNVDNRQYLPDNFLNWLLHILYKKFGPLDIWTREKNTRIEFGNFKSKLGEAIFTLNFKNKKPRFFVAGKSSVKRKLTNLPVNEKTKAVELSKSYHKKVILSVLHNDFYKSRCPTFSSESLTEFLSFAQGYDFILGKPNKKRLSKTRDNRAQAEFRKQAFRIYGNTCLITGDTPDVALEAAHIVPHKDTTIEESFLPWNCLLLRRDIHKLFDEGYLIVSKNLTVKLNKRALMDMGNYSHLDGMKLDFSSIDFENESFSRNEFVRKIKANLDERMALMFSQ